MTTRRLRLSLAGMAVSMLVIGFFAGALATPSPTSRPATSQERQFCLDNFEKLGPASGDCTKVPLNATVISEDDPYGRFNCVTMGNHQCGEVLFFNMEGQWQGYAIDAPNRPGCFVEPSKTVEGYEITFYEDIAYHGDILGFEIRCPG